MKEEETQSSGRIVLTLLLFFAAVFARSALAHDGWIEVAPAIVERGQPVTIALMHGNHSNKHRSYRLAGKWDPQYTRLRIFDPSGKAIELSDHLIDLGEDADKVGPKGPKGFQVASFTAKEQGSYVVIARQERTLTDEQSGIKLRTVRTARSALVALPVSTVKEAKKLRLPTAVPAAGDNLEILPVTSPFGVTSGDSVTLEVRYKGKPSPDRVVTVLRKMAGANSAQDFTTNGQGRISFTAGPADSYLSRAKFGETSERERASYEATYVFQVFNR